MEQSNTTNPYKHIQIVYHNDGTITRLRQESYASTSSDPSLPVSVLTKDVVINQSNNTFVRLFLPHRALDTSSSGNKLPLIVYLHGGGFIQFSATSTMFHNFCVKLSNHVGAVVASLEYRLAPEHRLPAAYDDAMEALHWIKSNQQEWLNRYADYSKCYLMGSSAGANIAYHAGLRAAAQDEHHLEPLKIRGLILAQPFLGGNKRTGSELRLLNDPVLPLCVTDLMWKLALPSGADRDHEYCNPRAGKGPDQLDKVRENGWRVLVTGCDGDPLVERQMEMVALMEEKGVQTVGRFVKGGCHGIEVRDPLKQKELFGVLKHFTGFSLDD